MIDRILIPTDGSEEAESAVEYALALAELAGSEIHALYVVETGATYILTVDIGDDTKREHEAYGEDTVGEIVDRASSRGLEGVGAVTSGNIASEIVEYAEENDIDNIVLGRQGRGAVEQYLGSTAEKVVRMSHVPVTVVRAD